MPRFRSKTISIPCGSGRRIAYTTRCQDNGVRHSSCSVLSLDTGGASVFPQAPKSSAGRTIMIYLPLLLIFLSTKKRAAPAALFIILLFRCFRRTAFQIFLKSPFVLSRSSLFVSNSCINFFLLLWTLFCPPL